MRHLLAGLLLASVTAFSTAAADPRIILSLDDIHSPVFTARAIQATLSGPRMSLLEVHLGEFLLQGKTWRDLHFICSKFKLDDGLVHCHDGVLRLPQMAPLPVTFQFSSRNKTLELHVRPAAGESWQFSARWGEAAWDAVLAVAHGQAAHIAEWLPDSTLPVPSKGEINGKARLRGHAGGLALIEANLTVDRLAFSDASGLHAGDDISGDVSVKAARQAGMWQWQADASWQHGEVFWQPLYFTGSGHRLDVSGEMDENVIRLLKGSLALAGIGKAEMAGVVERPANTLREFDLRADNLALSALFSQVLKPFLENTTFADVKAAGYADIRWRLHNGISESLNFTLRDAAVEDGRERFAFHGINASVPWHAQGRTLADIRFQNGQIARIPLGEVRVPLEIENLRFSIPRLTVPILDGALTLQNFSAAQQGEGWQWQFSGELSPISMQKLTEALKIQKMQGTLSGVIPEVSYAGSALKVDGTLLFNIFGGSVEVKNLQLLEPMGRAPYLLADLEMRNLDLDLLTGTFSFGNMQGRIDAVVNGLELINWKPVKFNAGLMSSPGKYPRSISQTAVQNISALGGAGAAVAIQRSFLRFFERFGYTEIGLSCTLRNGVCHMGGIEPAPYGYFIVKGGGIPAINVIGYNRAVDWQELINRLQRITQENVKPIIR